MDPNEPTEPYQHIVVRGTALERGESYGRQAAPKIKINIEKYRASSALPEWTSCLKYINDSYCPAIAKVFPEGLTEMRGIANGAGVPLEEIIFLNARYDLTRSSGQKVGECTSLALHGSDGTALVAQNWDISTWLHDLNTIIVLESHCDESGSSGPLRTIGLTEAGQLPRSGMNSRGLGLSANSLWTNEDKEPVDGQYLPFSLARGMYLRCPNLAAGLKTLSLFPRHVSGNLMIASPEVGMDLELSPTRKFVLRQLSIENRSGSVMYHLLTHANHFDHPSMTSASDQKTMDTYPGGSSLFRASRLYKLIETKIRVGKTRTADFQIKKEQSYCGPAPLPTTPDTPGTMSRANSDQGAEIHDEVERLQISHRNFTEDADLGVKDLKVAFCDHSSYPRSVCEHALKDTVQYGAVSSSTATMTVACVIYDLAKGLMHVSTGNPCRQNWSQYSIEMEKNPCS